MVRRQGARDEPGEQATSEPAVGGVDYGALHHHLGYVLRRAQIAIFSDLFEAFAALRITLAQYSILVIVDQNPGLFQTQVADALGIKKTNFVAVIVALERRGYVRRTPMAHDRRSYGLYLSDEGQALLRQLNEIAGRHEARLIAAVGTEAYAALFAPLRLIAGLK